MLYRIWRTRSKSAIRYSSLWMERMLCSNEICCFPSKSGEWGTEIAATAGEQERAKSYLTTLVEPACRLRHVVSRDAVTDISEHTVAQSTYLLTYSMEQSPS